MNSKFKVKHTRLTELEIEVVQLTSQGYTAKEIAEQLGKNEKAVVATLARARRKLGARNTLHAVVIALRQKLI